MEEDRHSFAASLLLLDWQENELLALVLHQISEEDVGSSGSMTTKTDEKVRAVTNKSSSGQYSTSP